uniref:Uncharacterized protein n=1 Tax=Plectus sambesii TaxID=2011161 RepID=A0A914W5L1_9BILA
MQMANIVMMTTCLIILLCWCGDCVRLRNSGRKKLKETTHSIHRERSPPQTPEKNRMKKYFADKLNPYLNELENTCVRLCVEKEENDRKGREILEKQQSTDNDSSGDEIEIVAEEAPVQNVINAEKVESAIELNQNKSEDPFPAESETAATHGGETLLHEEHEDGEISQTSTDIHEVDHKEADHGMEHNKEKKTDEHGHLSLDHSHIDRHDDATDEEHHNHETDDKASEKAPPSPTSLILWTVGFVVFLATVTIVALKSEIQHGH